MFSCKVSAPSMRSKWIIAVVCFVRRCIIRHISERIAGWYNMFSARRFTGHWRIVASQLELFRTLGRWRRRQKLLRHFRGWRVLCGEECKVRLHRCYYDSISYLYIMRRFMTIWHLHVCSVSSAKSRLLNAVTAFALRRAFCAWKRSGPILAFMNRRYHGDAAKLKRAMFHRLHNWRSLCMQLQQRAESMKASVHAASTRRLLRSAFKTFF